MVRYVITNQLSTDRERKRLEYLKLLDIYFAFDWKNETIFRGCNKFGGKRSNEGKFMQKRF